jgi:hypothetical protein
MPVSSASQRLPALRHLPRLSQLRDVLALASGVEPLDQADVGDYVDPITGRLAYRFFRDCELAPFVACAEDYRPLNAWYLSEASLLAYASATPDAERLGNGRAEAELMSRRVLPTLTRLFEAQRASSAGGSPRPLAVHCLARDVNLLGMLSSLHCYVVDDGELGFVVFRGTQPTSLPNWLTDCEINMIDPDGPAGDSALVHEGFWRACSALLDDDAESAGLRRYLLERHRQAPGLNLWFAGHSLGGALATLAAYRLGNAQGLYTFGSPRVGNDDFANAFSRKGLKHYRVVHRHDIVAHMPIDLPFLDYEHVGELKYVAWSEASEAGAADLAHAEHEHEHDEHDEHDEHPPRVSLWQRIRDSAGDYDLGRLGSWLGHITDHSLLYYSSVLWNDFVGNHTTGPRRDDT